MRKLSPTIRNIVAVLGVGALGVVAVATGADNEVVAPTASPTPTAVASPSPSQVGAVSITTSTLSSGGESGMGSFTVSVENPTLASFTGSVMVECLDGDKTVFTRTLPVTVAPSASATVKTESETLASEGLVCAAALK